MEGCIQDASNATDSPSADYFTTPATDDNNRLTDDSLISKVENCTNYQCTFDPRFAISA